MRYPLVPSINVANIGNSFLYRVDDVPMSMNRADVSYLYGRSSEATGFDIAADLEDLQVTNTGDLSIYSGVEVITNNLLRRLTTPPGGYGRYLHTAQGVEVYDDDYCNEAYRYISSPLVSSLPGELTGKIFDAASKESRITINSVDILGSVYNKDVGITTGVNIELNYNINSNQELIEARVQIPIIKAEAI